MGRCGPSDWSDDDRRVWSCFVRVSWNRRVWSCIPRWSNPFPNGRVRSLSMERGSVSLEKKARLANLLDMNSKSPRYPYYLVRGLPSRAHISSTPMVRFLSPRHKLAVLICSTRIFTGSRAHISPTRARHKSLHWASIDSMRIMNRGPISPNQWLVGRISPQHQWDGAVYKQSP